MKVDTGIMAGAADDIADQGAGASRTSVTTG